jgi:hypothetical protein
MAASGSGSGSVMQFCLVRTTFEGAQQILPWQLPRTASTTHPSMISWSQKRSSDQVFLSHPDYKVCPLQSMPVADGFPAQVNLVQSPIASRDVRAAAFSPGGTLWLAYSVSNDLHLGSFLNERTLISDIYFDRNIVRQDSICLSVLENHLALGMNEELQTFETSQGLHREKGSVQKFEQPILSLVACPRWTKPHLAVVMSSQIALTWFSGAQAHSYVIGADFDQPRVAFTNDGLLIVLTADEGYLYDCDSKGVKSGSRFSFAAEVPIAVMAATEVRSFATLDGTGKVKMYRAARDLFRA